MLLLPTRFSLRPLLVALAALPTLPASAGWRREGGLPELVIPPLDA